MATPDRKQETALMQAANISHIIPFWHGWLPKLMRRKPVPTGAPLNTFASLISDKIEPDKFSDQGIEEGSGLSG